jgi:hypothetical protein
MLGFSRCSLKARTHHIRRPGVVFGRPEHEPITSLVSGIHVFAIVKRRKT